MRKTVIVALTAMAAAPASCGQSAGFDENASPVAIAYETGVGFGTLANETHATPSSSASDALVQGAGRQPAPCACSG